MFDSDMLQQAALRIKEKNASPEYQKAIERFRGEMIRMEQLAAELEAKLPAIRALAEKETVRTEYACGSDLHRGYYCPSPVFDFVVSNAHRGKLLKQVTMMSKPSHEYGFSSDGRLLWCRCLHNKATVMTEYLVTDGARIIGIMLGSDEQLKTVSEEIVQDGKLLSFLQAKFWLGSSPRGCQEITAEHYVYDENGLLSSQWHELMLPMKEIPAFLRDVAVSSPFLQQPIYRSNEFLYERADGFLSGYRSHGQLYKGLTKRSANPIAQINGINLMDIKE